MPDDDSFQSSSSEGTGGLFPHTRWTLIANVQQEEDSDVKQRALAELCRIYWYPIYIFLRKKGKTKEDAEDLTQGLFARMLQHESFSAASQELGRLRSYLLKAASAMMAEDWRRATAQKRGGTDVLLSIEVEMAEKRFQNEPSTSISPEKLFDKNWALVLLKEVEERLREDYERRGKADLFEALRPYIAGKNSDTGPGKLHCHRGDSGDNRRCRESPNATSQGEVPRVYPRGSGGYPQRSSRCGRRDATSLCRIEVAR